MQKEAIGLKFIMSQLHSYSPYGKEEIKKITCFVPGSEQELEKELDNIGRILKFKDDNPQHIERIVQCLTQFKNIWGIIKKIPDSTLNEVELFEIKGFLLDFAVFFETYENKDYNVDLWGIQFAEMTEALKILDPTSGGVAPFHIDSVYSQTLAQIRQEKFKIERKIEFLEPDKKEEKERLLEQRRLLASQEEDEELIVMQEITNNLRLYLDVFARNMVAIGKLDLVLQKAYLADCYNATRPKIGKNNISIVDVENPYIAHFLAQKGKKMTKISARFDQGVTMITGANMGGKSVALKTIVLNAVLFQMGFFVFAKSAVLPLFHDICLISEDMQDVEKGLSTFGAEIFYFNGIINKIRKSFMLLAIDEFARGTNPKEGAGIVNAIATFLSAQNAISIMTTHYDGVVQPNFGHYQVAGLTAFSANGIEQFREKAKTGLDFITEHMDYSLVQVNHNTEIPKDAVNICRIIELDEEVLKLIEGNIE
ncbi:MAG: hypothetical protein FWG63_03215 [Defluviitaleaceae bacterium]|nr:hypothetical protein [Defluviitaleaceae bacterium]